MHIVLTNVADILLQSSTQSRHRLFHSWIPLHNATSSLIHQRKVILHGARARETPEDAIEKETRKEIRLVLPELFEGIVYFLIEEFVCSSIKL